MENTPLQPDFTPVPTRPRADGWTPAAQVRFIEALAEGGCVTEACQAVALSASSAYRLRARPDAQAFRLAWDNAIDYAMRRLSDAVVARALHGEVVPHYYRGELVGEHRRYDNRLAQFLLRYRDPLRYGQACDAMLYEGTPERAAHALHLGLERVEEEAHGFAPRGAVPDGPPWIMYVRPSSAEQRDDLAALIDADEDAREGAAR